VFPANGTLPLQACPTLATCSYLATGAYNFLDLVHWHPSEKTYSQEFDLNSKPGGPLDWVAGLYYFRDRTDFNEETLGLFGPFGPGGALTGALPPWPASSFAQYTFPYLGVAAGVAESRAVFADATYNLDDFHFTLGGRYDVDHPGVRFSAPANLTNGFVAFPYTSSNTSFSSFTPRAVVRYSLTPNSNVYISWSKGDKAGVYNASGYATQKSVNNAVVQPERVTDVEGGYKLSLADTQLEFSAYHYDYKNLQVATYLNGIGYQQNAPKSRMWGADLHLLQRVLSDVSMDGGVAYTHARYVDFRNAALQTYSTLYGTQNATTDVSGGVMERTPSVTANVGVTYSHPVLRGVLDLNANYWYQTKASFDFANTIVQKGYGLLNLRAAWTEPSGRWTFSISGRNLTNSTYLTQVLPDSGGFTSVYGEPPNVLGEIAYKF
jgi:iron complex outermembrane receptor protein